MKKDCDFSVLHHVVRLLKEGADKHFRDEVSYRL